MDFLTCPHRDCARTRLGPDRLALGSLGLGGWRSLWSQAVHDCRCAAMEASEAHALLRAMLTVQGNDRAPSSGPGDEEAWGGE